MAGEPEMEGGHIVGCPAIDVLAAYFLGQGLVLPGKHLQQSIISDTIPHSLQTD